MATTKGWSISGTTATYYDSTGAKAATLTGLKSGLKAVADKDGVNQISGITVSGTTFTLSDEVFGYTDIKLANNSTTTYSMKLAGNYGVNTNAGGWLVSGTTAYLLNGSSSGYTLSGDTIKYTAAQPGDKTLATLTGLKDGVGTNKDAKIVGITVNGTTVTIDSKKILGGGDVTIDSGYKLAAGDNLKAQPTGDVTWTVPKDTTASFTTATTESYTLDKTGTKLTHVAAGSATVTLSGLAKGTTAETLNGGSATVSNGTITLKSDVLGSKVTVKGGDYKLALATDTETAKVTATATPVWNKASKATKATYDQVFTDQKGKYYCDGTTISTLSKDTQTVTLATLSGLAKDDENPWDGKKTVAGITVADGVITLSDPTMFTTSNITLGKNDAYSLAVNSDFDVYTSRLHWDYNPDKGGTAKIVRTTEAGYEQKDSKTVNYLKSTSTTLATVSGVTKDLRFDEYDAAKDKADTGNTTDIAKTGTIDGLTFKDGVITVSAEILEAGDTVLDKTTETTGVKKLTLGANDKYVFAFDKDVTEPEDQPEVWKLGYKTDSKTKSDVGTGTWTYSRDTTEGWAIDTSTKGASKTINYNAPKTTTLATLSGVTTSLDFDDVDSDYVIEGNKITYTDEGETTVLEVTEPSTDSEGNAVKGQIVLNELAFAGKKISLKGSDYTIGLDADYGVKDISEANATWVADTKGKAVLTGGKSAGYDVDAKTSLAINYTAPKVTAYATITGLATAKDAEEAAELGEALDAATNKKAKTITLSEDMMPTFTGDTAETDKEKKTKVALGSKDTYTFVLNDDDKYQPDSKGASWSVDKDKSNKPNGSASYKANMVAGYLTSSDSKTVNYKQKGETTLFTLSGLSKDGSVVAQGDALGYNNGSSFVSAITANSSTKKVTLSDSTIFGGTKISLKNGSDSYALEVADALKDGNLSAPTWNISGGKATYYKGTKGGYAVDAKGTTASYTNPKATTTLAEITGLSKNTSVKSFQINKSGSDNLILITTDAVTTSATKLTKGDGYKLSLYGVPSPTSTDNDWTQKGTTATITRDTTDGWSTTSDGKTINYSKAKSETVVTVSGLAQGVTATKNNLIFDSENQTVTVTSDDLLAGTKKVSLKSGIKGETYKFKLGANVTTTTTTTDYWDVSNGKATYYHGKTPHYVLGKDDASVDYTTYKADSTLATITGLKKTATASDFTLSNDGVITLKSTALDTSETAVAKTKVALKGDGYTLALGTDLTAAVLKDEWGTVDSKGKVLYERGIKTNGYVVSADEKAISYGKTDDKKTTLATLSGVKAAPKAPTDGVITITSAQLDGKKITLGSKDPYTLELASSGVNAPTASGTWTVSKGTATLKGQKTDGYLQTDSKTIGYTAKSTKDETLATIKGVTAESMASLTSGSTEVDLSSVTLSNNVTVDGKGILAFDFGSHKDASITGSGSNDSLKFAGSGLIINAAKGNDYIDLGSSHSGADNLLYASGDGYDIVDGFKATDKITVSKAKTAAVKQEDGNTIITIDNKGSITLQNFTSTPTIEGVTVTTASSDLLLDDNYSMDAATLSELVTANTGSYSPYQFNNTLKLTKEENFLPAIAYASDKK